METELRPMPDAEFENKEKIFDLINQLNDYNSDLMRKKEKFFNEEDSSSSQSLKHSTNSPNLDLLSNGNFVNLTGVDIIGGSTNSIDPIEQLTHSISPIKLDDESGSGVNSHYVDEVAINNDLENSFNEISHSSETESSNLNETSIIKRVSRIPTGKQIILNKNNTTTVVATVPSSQLSKIPKAGSVVSRIPKASMSSIGGSSSTNLTSSSVSSISNRKDTSSITTSVSQEIEEPKIEVTTQMNEQPHSSRSIARSVGKNSSKLQQPTKRNTSQIPQSTPVSSPPIVDNNNNNLNGTTSPIGGHNSKLTKPRGVSLSTAVSNRSIRSLSINGDDDISRINFNDSKSSDGSANKTVKYVVRHKPKESNVKIFSQKVEVKNVNSKIGSLEKANYKPGGGNVVIESKSLNWKAEPKIGSLQRADYRPAGGNVKIETHKLNFKERARPKTDTGLIIIETDSQQNSLMNSQCVSIENMNETQDSY